MLELKSAASEDATIWIPHQQLTTCKAQVPALFATIGVLIASEGVEVLAATLSAGREWFKPWRSIAGKRAYGKTLTYESDCLVLATCPRSPIATEPSASLAAQAA